MKTPNLDQLIGRTRWSLLVANVFRGLLLAWAIVLVALLSVILIDAGLGLPGWGLLLLDVLLLAALIYALRLPAASLLRGRVSARRAAVHLEAHLPVDHNHLINALDLASQPSPHSSEALREKAVALGEADALKNEARTVVDPAPIKRAVKPAVAATLGLILLLLIALPVFRAVVPRLAMPFADLPPFTRVRFNVSYDPQPAYVGRPMTLYVKLTGPTLPSEARVVFIENDAKTDPIMMTPIADPSNKDPEAKPAHRFALPLQRFDQPISFYIDTDEGRSAVYTFSPDTAPQFQSASVHYDYPDYTRWPDSTRPLFRDGIRALQGADVSLSVQSNVNLKGGTFRLIHQDTSATPAPTDYQLTPDPADPHTARITFPLQSSGRFELSLIGTDGTPSDRTLKGDVTALPDRTPKVRIVSPDRRAVVPEGWPIETTIEAGDDIAVDNITLHLALNDAPTTPVPLDQTYQGDGRTSASAGYAFPPGVLGAKAGDTLRYYASASDNHPDPAQTAESQIHALYIITMQQYIDLARSQYRVEELNQEFDAFLKKLGQLQTMRENMLDDLADMQQRLDKGERLSTEDQQRMAELQNALADYAKQTASLADELKQRADQTALYDFEHAYKQMLRELADGLDVQSKRAEALSRALEDSHDQDSAESRSALALESSRFELADQPFDKSSQARTEQTQQDVEKLKLAEAMLTQGERIRRIAQEQDELAVRMSSLASPGKLSEQDRAHTEALSQEQARLRDELADAADKLRQAAEQAGEALPTMSRGAMDVADKIDALGIVSTQSAAEKATLAGNGPLAYQAAREAADKLDSLLSDTPQQPSQAAGDLDGCFNLPRENWHNALQQLAAGRHAPGMGEQGSSGMGRAGQSARMAMIGPPLPGQPGSDSDARSGRNAAAHGQGPNASNNPSATGYTDTVRADSANPDPDAVAHMPGVPPEYRDQAAAYFKRLAEDE